MLDTVASSLAILTIGCSIWDSLRENMWAGMITPFSLKRSLDPAPDVYGYNFPNDRGSLKAPGEHSRLILCFSQLVGKLRLTCCLPSGDHSDSSDLRRGCLPLVYGRVRGYGLPVDHLGNHNFSVIDGSPIDATISHII